MKLWSYIAAALLIAPATVAADPPTGISPTLVTVHEHQATFKAVITKILSQADIPFFVDDAPTAQNVTVDADQQPLWVVLASACDQVGFSIDPQFNGQTTSLRFLPNPTESKYRFISGPVLAKVQSVEHLSQMTATPAQQDFCDATVQVNWEPRLDVLMYEVSGAPTLAVDENGVSLVPTAKEAESDPRQPGYRGMFGNNVQMRQQYQQNQSTSQFSIRLKVPPQAGRHITHLQGQLKLWVADKKETGEIDNISQAIKSHPHFTLGKLNCSVSGGNVGAGQVQIQVRIPRNGEPQESWTRRQMLLQAMKSQVLDADGHEWSAKQQSNGYGYNGNDMTLYIYSSRSQGVTTLPVKVVLEASLDPTEIDVPYDLHDLPLP